MNHTPGPWRVGYKDGSGPDQIVTEYDGELPSKSIAVVSWGCGCCKHDAKEEDFANAAHIVHCVNTHAALVEALQGLLDITDDPNLNWVEILDKIEKAKKALTLAEGKEQS